MGHILNRGISGLLSGSPAAYLCLAVNATQKGRLAMPGKGPEGFAILLDPLFPECKTSWTKTVDLPRSLGPWLGMSREGVVDHLGVNLKE